LLLGTTVFGAGAIFCVVAPRWKKSTFSS